MQEREPLPAVAPHRAAWIALLTALGLGLLVVARIFLPFVGVVVLATVAAGILAPVHRWLVVATGGHRRWASFILCLLLLVALMVPLFMIARAVSEEALAFYEMSTTQLTEQSLRTAIEERSDILGRINRLGRPFGFDLTPDEVYEQITTAGVKLGAFFYRQGVSLAGHLLRLVLAFVFWVLVLYYLLLDGARLREWFLLTIPLPKEQQDMVVHRFMDMASSIVVGNGVAGVIQGVVGGLIFALLGLPGAVLWGVVMSVLAFIPVIGISFVYLPVSLLLFLAGETSDAVIVLGVLASVATVVEYWLKPILVGRRSQVHTLLVFLSLIGGVDAFGAVGLLLGPLVMTAFLTLVSIFQERYRPFVRTVSAAQAAAAASPGATAAENRSS